LRLRSARCSEIHFKAISANYKASPAFAAVSGTGAVFFEVAIERKHVVVTAIERRTSTTY
jgi:hypothetical protein